jgi:hypothetical protein
LPQVHAEFYLRPELRIVSDAGRSNVIETIASLAEFLMSHGSSDLLISAIRGDNILPHLETILPLESLPPNSQVSSARVEIGGGPFAAAFAEGARFVIAGTYDIAAPLLGAAVAHGYCGWEDYTGLARLAAAAYFSGVTVELGADGSIELESAAIEQLDRVRALSVITQSDVRVDMSELALEATSHNTLSLSNVHGETSHAMWNARIVVDTGFQATALVEGGADKTKQHLESVPQKFDGGSLSHTEYLPAARQQAGQPLMRIEYRSDCGESCFEFLDWLQSSAESDELVGHIVAPRPTVERLSEVLSVQIPADAVTISVDTRPAREWL